MMDEVGKCGSTGCGANNAAKYFFICAAGTKYIDISTLVDTSTESSEIEKLLGEADDAKMKLKGKMPITSHNNVIIEARNGQFIPSMIENHIKKTYGLDDVSITFVREISKAEYDADQLYKADLNKPTPLGYSTLQEIDDLLNRSASGDLQVLEELRPDFARNGEEKDLMDLNLPMNLFDDTGLWDDDSGDKE